MPPSRQKENALQVAVFRDKASDAFADLRKAARRDLEDCMKEVELSLSKEVIDGEMAWAEFLESDEPRFAISEALIGASPMLIEGLLAPIEEDFDAVVCPSTDGGIYGFSLALPLTPAQAKSMAHLLSGNVRADELVTFLIGTGSSSFVQVPWYCARDNASVRGALSHLRAMDRSEDPDFVALHSLKALEVLEKNL